MLYCFVLCLTLMRIALCGSMKPRSAEAWVYRRLIFWTFSNRITPSKILPDTLKAVSSSPGPGSLCVFRVSTFRTTCFRSLAAALSRRERFGWTPDHFGRQELLGPGRDAPRV